MVTSLVDIWVIAVLNHSYYKVEWRQAISNKGVKEQRVDGFSNFMNLHFVRYTLVAGKPVFELIHIHSYIRINFILGLVKNNSYKMGYQI